MDRILIWLKRRPRGLADKGDPGPRATWDRGLHLGGTRWVTEVLHGVVPMPCQPHPPGPTQP